jgi:hypothetical protein
MLARGTLLAGRFEIEREAGSGGFGTVYRAFDRRDTRAVAVKVLHEARREAADAARFAREAQLLAELQHPNIVAFIDQGMTTEGQPFLAMEWLEGESLSERLERQPVTIREAVQLVRLVASALGEAHRRGIVHRDLKPSNLLLRDRQVARVTVLDLGIARRAGLTLSASGQVMGTPRYMAPEQAWGAETGPPADVFALGCVAFECITGSAAYLAVESAAALAEALFGNLRTLASVRPDVAPEIGRLVDRMLSREPSARPRDATELLAELDALPSSLDGPAPDRGTQRSFGREELHLASVLVATGGTTLDQGLVSEVAARATHVEQRASDGALLATFLHEGPSAFDQAANAAAVARLVRERAPQTAVAVVTGRIRDARRPDGEIVDRACALAARVLRAVGLDELTRTLLADRVKIGTQSGVSIVLDEAIADESRLLLGQPTPCVGREQELATLELVFDAVDQGASRAVLVIAEAGGGKSRLRHELVRRLAARGRPPLVLAGRGEALHTAASFGLLARALHAMTDGADLAERRTRIRERVARHLVGDDAERVASFIGEMCGAPFEDSARLRGARIDPRAMRAQITSAWVDFLRAECAAGTVLLLLDDLHWADPGSLDLVDVALREIGELPLFVVGFARPELLARRSDLWRGRVQELPLRALGRRACTQLVRGILGEAMPEAEVDRLVDRSAGNALFLEELIRAAHDGNVETAPVSVLAMLQARIGRLAAPLRRVLRAASILGASFEADGLRAIHGDLPADADVGRWLDELVREETVELRRGELLLGGQAYRFRHALMREAVYDLLTESDRQLGHAAAASFLVARDGDPAVVAEHFAQCGDVASALRYLLSAVERAYDSSDHETAGQLAKRGLALGAAGEARGAMIGVEALNAVRSWDWQAGTLSATEALALLSPGSAWWSRTVTAASAFYAYRNQQSAAQALAEEVLATEPAAGATMHYVHALAHVGSAMIQTGLTAVGRRALERIPLVAPDLDEYPAVRGFVDLIHCTLLRHTTDDMALQLEYLRRASRLFASLGGDPISAVLAEDGLGEVLARAGQQVEAQSVLRHALAIAEEQSPPYARTHAAMSFAHGLLVREEREADEEAERLARRVLDTKGISAGFGAMARHVLAQVLARRGERALAAVEADSAIALSQHTPVRLLHMLATRMRLHERAEDALPVVDAALRLLDGMGGEGGFAEAPTQLAAAEIYLGCGRRSRAAPLLDCARRRVLARADAFAGADREQFLVGVPLHRRVVELADEVLGERSRES